MDRSSRYADPDFIGALDRYLAEKLTASEADAFRASLVTDTSVERVVSELRCQWHALGTAGVDLASARAALMGRLESGDAPAVLGNGRNELVGRGDRPYPRVDGVGIRGRQLGKQTLRQWMTLPVSVTVIAVLCLVAVVVSYHRGTHLPNVQRTQSYATAGGQQAALTLSDGSHVLLGSATKLSVTTDPADASINVYVIGQAFFTVTHHRAQPFRVHAGNAVARVLGTAFLVRQYDTDSVARVVVTSGRVSLSGLRGGATVGPSRVLTANTVGTVDDSGAIQMKSHEPVDGDIAWTTGQLVFLKTPARAAVIELGRAYGVDIRIVDSTLAAQPLSWTVPVAQQSLADVLEALVDVLNAHVVRAGRVITIVPGRSSSPRSPGLRYPSSPERQYGR